MLKTLVAIEVDLASNMAIRYACHLGNLVPMELYPVYVKQPPFDFPMTGVGWARRTWEREIVTAGREEIQEMLEAEMDSCPVLKEPRVIYGDREIELLKILERESFDLYIEGAPYPFNPATIVQRLHQKLYQRISIPFIWLRTLRKVNQILVPAMQEEAIKATVPVISKLMAGSNIPIHIGILNKNLMEAAVAAKEELSRSGHDSVITEIADLTPQEATKNYGMVVVNLDRAVKKDNAFLQWVAQVKAPMAIVLSSTK